MAASLADRASWFLSALLRWSGIGEDALYVPVDDDYDSDTGSEEGEICEHGVDNSYVISELSTSEQGIAIRAGGSSNHGHRRRGECVECLVRLGMDPYSIRRGIPAKRTVVFAAFVVVGAVAFITFWLIAYSAHHAELPDVPLGSKVLQNNITLPNADYHSYGYNAMPFWHRSEMIPNADDVSLALQMTCDRLELLAERARQWKGPISAALYMFDHSDTQLIVEFIENDPVVALYVDIHLCFAPRLARGAEDLDAKYPINWMRNQAICRVETEWMFLVDADESVIFDHAYYKATVLASAEFADKALGLRGNRPEKTVSSNTRGNQERTKTLDYVLAVTSYGYLKGPAEGIFPEGSKVPMIPPPTSKADLTRGITTGDYDSKHSYFPNAYTPPLFLETGKPELTKLKNWYPAWDKLEQPLYMPFGFKYEPYYIQRVKTCSGMDLDGTSSLEIHKTDVPYAYDHRLVGWGGNKNLHFMRMMFTNVTFFLMPNVFTFAFETLEETIAKKNNALGKMKSSHVTLLDTVSFEMGDHLCGCKECSFKRCIVDCSFCFHQELRLGAVINSKIFQPPNPFNPRKVDFNFDSVFGGEFIDISLTPSPSPSPSFLPIIPPAPQPPATVFPFWHRATDTAARLDPNDITLAIQLDVWGMDILKQRVERWKGPVSAAILISNTSEDVAVVSAAINASEDFARYVDIHLCFRHAGGEDPLFVRGLPPLHPSNATALPCGEEEEDTLCPSLIERGLPVMQSPSPSPSSSTIGMGAQAIPSFTPSPPSLEKRNREPLSTLARASVGVAKLRKEQEAIENVNKGDPELVLQDKPDQEVDNMDQRSSRGGAEGFFPAENSGSGRVASVPQGSSRDGKTAIGDGNGPSSSYRWSLLEIGDVEALAGEQVYGSDAQLRLSSIGEILGELGGDNANESHAVPPLLQEIPLGLPEAAPPMGKYGNVFKHGMQASPVVEEPIAQAAGAYDDEENGDDEDERDDEEGGNVEEELMEWATQALLARDFLHTLLPPHPTNWMRNQALCNVRTNWVFVLDLIDDPVFPHRAYKAEVTSAYEKMAQENELQMNSTIFSIASFERLEKPNATNPVVETFSDLQIAVKGGDVDIARARTPPSFLPLELQAGKGEVLSRAKEWIDQFLGMHEAKRQPVSNAYDPPYIQRVPRGSASVCPGGFVGGEGSGDVGTTGEQAVESATRDWAFPEVDVFEFDERMRGWAGGPPSRGGGYDGGESRLHVLRMRLSGMSVKLLPRLFTMAWSKMEGGWAGKGRMGRRSDGQRKRLLDATALELGQSYCMCQLCEFKTCVTSCPHCFDEDAVVRSKPKTKKKKRIIKIKVIRKA